MEEKPSEEIVSANGRNDAYELDLNEAESAEVDDVMRDALAAVTAVEEKRSQQKEEEDSELDVEIETETDAQASAPVEPEVIVDSAEPKVGDGAETEELRQRLMRTLADFDNFRKRSEKEKQDHKRFAVTEVLKDILSVTDNLDRAVAASGSVEELKQGVEMIIRQQGEVLRRWGVEPVKAVGEPFDPAVHEAVAREDSTEIEVPMVTGEHQRGYVIHGRLLRPAMVSVAMPAAKSVGKEGKAEE